MEAHHCIHITEFLLRNVFYDCFISMSFFEGVSASSEIEPVHDKYLPLPLADQFLETTEHIRFHLSLNVNYYRDSASVSRH